ncbi:hypothetical protein HK105_204787 [Polyrhizophydium stewartii]|uniref:Uncharacterized protein n=1 Tax=Polyrhizophydium stewartii TaxID=2732419 RepID=A0ABR4N7U4_9FUNG
MRTMTHPKSVLKSVVYMPFGETERFASQDAHYAHVWRGSTHILKVATRPNKDALPTSVTGLNKWLYINKWRILIIATLHLELKILDAGLKVWSSIASPKPIISLEFVDEHDELVVGGVGAITIYGFEKNHGSSGAIVDFKEPRLVINDLQIDEWVTFTAFDRTREYLYAVFDNNFTIYSYITGHRIESMRNVHENSISAVLFYEPLSYFVTGSKDATIKVWNQQNYLLYEFKDHYNAITGFCQVNGFGCGAFPYILSCSLDGTIRMWNLENGRFIYKMHTQAECLGMHWMRDGTFFSYSSETISVWFLSRFYTTLTQIRQVADGSMSLVSPRTGERLTTAFPVMADTFMVDCVYDIGLDLIYTLATNGDVTVYSSFSNPCAIIDEWKYVASGLQEKMICVCGLPVNRNEIVVPPVKSKPVTVLLLVGGTENGQILLRDVRQHGRQELMIQAHAGSIVSVSCDGTGDKLFSTSRDSTIRIWSIEYLDSGFGNSKILENAQHKLSGGPVHILLTLFATIQTTPIDGIPMRCCYSSMVRILAVAMENHSLRLFTIGLNRNVDQMKHHPRDEDHTKSVMDIAVFETQHFCVFASCGSDGTVKIWDALTNSLAREMQFENPMWSVCFGNARGDLMVGLSDQIALVQVQDYLPAKYLLRLLERDWPDDPIESSTTFDAALDFWKLYREQIKAAGNEPALWHVA